MGDLDYFIKARRFQIIQAAAAEAAVADSVDGWLSQSTAAHNQPKANIHANPTGSFIFVAKGSGVGAHFSSSFQ